MITTVRAGPELRVALDSVYEQTLALGGEVILADGSARGFPDVGRFVHVRHLHLPGRHVFHLRAVALTAARAPVVALTEDHCRVAADWCRQTLRAHREHPEAAMIGGCIVNGAGERLVDWANFFVSNGPYLPPVEISQGPNITGQANVSYKRDVLDGYPGDALDEGAFRRGLDAAGARLLVDDRMVVEHVQSLTVLETLRIHFHDGRCVAAALRRRASFPRSLAALAMGLAWPVRVPAATARVVLRTLIGRPGLRSTVLRSAPWILAVIASHKAGELLGSLTGAGRSPDHMR